MVRIYYCKTENFEHRYEEALPLLSPERRTKTERYLKKEDKLLSLTTGLMLKKIFGDNYADKLSYNEHGKPIFEHGLCFSVSHSRNISALAVSKNNIGVDIEGTNAVSQAVIKRCFTEDEQDYACLSTRNARRLWTAKEAVLKLLGTGFGLSPKNFSVLPLTERHEINGVEIRFFCAEIEELPLTLAYEGDEDEFEILEFQPEDLI